MNMVETKTRLESLIDQKDNIMDSAANIISAFVLDNSGSRSQSQFSDDIKKLLKGFSEEEKNIILTKALAIVASNTKSKKHNSKSGGGESSANFLRNLR